MENTKYNIVFHILKCDELTNSEESFLTQLFNLKVNQYEKFNINKFLIDISFTSKVCRTFGNKPHKLLIFYKTSKNKSIKYQIH